MKKFRTVMSVITMIIAGIVGCFIGATMDEAMNGSILFSMIAGFTCIVYMIDNPEKRCGFIIYLFDGSLLFSLNFRRNPCGQLVNCPYIN